MATGSRLEYIRTDIGVGISISAGAVVGEARVLTTIHQLVVVLDSVLPSSVVDTEPASVSGSAALHTRNIAVGIKSIHLSPVGCGNKLRLLGRRAAVEVGPLVVGAGNCEGTGELNFSNTPNSGVEDLGGTVGVDIGEEGRWPDGIVSRSRSSEVVRSGD